jgi:hypothetical protein
VRIVGISNGRIPWPLASKLGRGRCFVLYGDLAKAVRREAGIAVAYWWGVRADTVSRWRKALGVGRTTKGSHVLKSAYTREPWARTAWKKARLMAKAPEAIAKIAAAMRGRRMPKHVAAILRRAHLGRKASAEARRKMREAHLRRRSLPPGVKPWTAAEDALIRRLPVSEVVRRTGRSKVGVTKRRRKLRIPDGRRRGSGKAGRWAALDAEGRPPERTADGRWRPRGQRR